jgi:hypothetical protein
MRTWGSLAAAAEVSEEKARLVAFRRVQDRMREYLEASPKPGRK